MQLKELRAAAIFAGEAEHATQRSGRGAAGIFCSLPLLSAVTCAAMAFYMPTQLGKSAVG